MTSPALRPRASAGLSGLHFDDLDAGAILGGRQTQTELGEARLGAAWLAVVGGLALSPGILPISTVTCHGLAIADEREFDRLAGRDSAPPSWRDRADR